MVAILSLTPPDPDRSCQHQGPSKRKRDLCVFYSLCYVAVAVDLAHGVKVDYGDLTESKGS